MPEAPLQRKPSEHWRYLKSDATWATHLNDIRILAKSGEKPDWQRTLLRELKLLCLFHGRRVILADSDLNNNPSFQELFLHDVHGIRSAFASSRLLLALRDTATGLADLNRQQGRRRANPEMADRARPFAEMFDAFHDDKGLVAVEWKLAASADGFEQAVKRLAFDSLSPLSTDDRDIVQQAMKAARDVDPEGRLFFGNIYDHIVRKLQYPNTHAAVQGVRAAHMLSTCRRLGFSPSVPLLDGDVSYAQFVSGSTSTPLSDSLVRSAPLPSRILTDASLDAIDFSLIPTLQDLGDSIGYFAALEAARLACGSPAFGEAYVSYLQKLEEYLQALGREASIELLDWQKQVLRAKREEIDADATRKTVFAVCLPLLVVPVAVVLSGMSGFALVGLSLLGAKMVEVVAKKKRQPLTHFIDGTATFATVETKD